MKCSACGEPMRKAQVVTLLAVGFPRVKACQRCVGRALVVVAPLREVTEADPEMGAFLSGLMAAFREVAKNADMADVTSRDKGDKALREFFAGRAEGLRAAAETFRTFASAQEAAPLAPRMRKVSR